MSIISGSAVRKIGNSWPPSAHRTTHLLPTTVPIFLLFTCTDGNRCIACRSDHHCSQRYACSSARPLQRRPQTCRRKRSDEYCGGGPICGNSDRMFGVRPTRSRRMTPIAQRKCVPSGVAVPGRNTGFVSPSSSSRKHHWPRQQSRDVRIQVPLAGLFAARPKTYDLRAPSPLSGSA
jgi:hypothetical protein